MKILESKINFKSIFFQNIRNFIEFEFRLYSKDNQRLKNTHSKVKYIYVKKNSSTFAHS